MGADALFVFVLCDAMAVSRRRDPDQSHANVPSELRQYENPSKAEDGSLRPPFDWDVHQAL